MNDGAPGRPGAEGRAGTPGMEGTHGARGEKGERGPRGPMRKWGPLYGYIVACAILTLVLYGLQFQVRGELISSCNRVNNLRSSFNERVAPLRAYGTILIRARQGPDALARDHDPQANMREVRRLRRVREDITTIALSNCTEEFQRPWPF